MKLVTRIAIWAALLLGLIWFVSATEWVEVDVQVPPRGAAARDDLYAARKLLPRLGMTVQSRTSLDVMPPAGARLLLTSSHWAFLKDRPKHLEDWVRAGGHLVLPARLIDPNMRPGEKALAWLPVGVRDRPKRTPASGPLAPPPRQLPAAEPDCHNVSDTQQQVLRICGWTYWREIFPMANGQADWQLRNDDNLEAIRIPFGKGSVTVVGPPVMNTRFLLRADNAQVFAAAMQAESGAVAWIVSEEARERLVPWIAQHGWVAVVLTLLAIAAGLWRSAVRFGPLALPATRSHRSMAEQVVGTAHFLLRHGPRSLHAAQLRALEEVATRRIAGFASANMHRRTALLAAHAHMDEHEIANAMRPRVVDRRALASGLAVMENARRRLEAAAPLPPKKEKDADQA